MIGTLCIMSCISSNIIKLFLYVLEMRKLWLCSLVCQTKPIFLNYIDAEMMKPVDRECEGVYLLIIPDLTWGSVLSVRCLCCCYRLQWCRCCFLGDWTSDGALTRLKLPSSYCTFQYHYYAPLLSYRDHPYLVRISQLIKI